jgi:hypothetical protein
MNIQPYKTEIRTARTQEAPQAEPLANSKTKDDTGTATSEDSFQPRRATFLEAASVVGVGVGATVVTAKVLGQIASASTPAGVAMGVLGSLASLAGGYMLADAASAPFHWYIDNYPDGDTPVIGKVADSFQGHHKDVHDLEKMDFVANMAQTTPLSTLPMLAVAALSPGIALGSAAVGFFGGITIAQAGHRLTHVKQIPGWARPIQGSLLQSKQDHNDHHCQPHAGNYAIINGLTNPLFDKTHVFRKMEKLIYDRTGKEPHTWLDPNLKAFAMGEISQAEYENVANKNQGRKVYRKEIQQVFQRIEDRAAAAGAAG